QKDGASAWTAEEFYALGESDWRDFLGHRRQNGIKKQNCLEIGCGAGGITRQLLGSVVYVYAVGVSVQMIRFSRKAVDSRNVEFSNIEGLHLSQSDRSVKAIFSTHVLQHLDSLNVGFSYFRKFFRILDVGKTIMRHLPLYQFSFDTGAFGVLLRSFYA